MKDDFYHRTLSGSNGMTLSIKTSGFTNCCKTEINKEPMKSVR